MALQQCSVVSFMLLKQSIVLRLQIIQQSPHGDAKMLAQATSGVEVGQQVRSLRQG